MTDLAQNATEIRQKDPGKTGPGGAERSLDELVVLNAVPGPSTLRLSVLIPTRNEAANVPELLRQLVQALDGTPSEIIFVDDSDDDTTDELIKVAPGCPVGLRLLHREPGQRVGGLRGAAARGA